MILKIYQILTVIFSPLIDLFLLIRMYFGKEEKSRLFERLGFSSIKRPEGDIIWFQCASVGESNSALPLIDKIIEKYGKNLHILITSGTVTSAKILSEKIKNRKNVIHQYTPVDKYFSILRFLEFWKPKILITIESEIWPNMITLSHKMCEKVMIVNAKMSEKSFSRWKNFKNLKESIFDSIDICYPQSEEDQYRFINLGIQNTLFLGNLKFDIPKLPVDQDYLKFLKSPTKERKIVLCASVHDKEIEEINDIFKNLNSKYSDLLFILALRHPNDSKNIYNFLNSKNYSVKKKSDNEIIENETNFYIHDELGNIGTLFELCDIVLMCGSLVDGIGGHTPIEPAKQGCAILTGPYIKNNKSLFKELENNHACIICKDKKNISKDLSKYISVLFNDKNEETRLKNNAKIVCDKFVNVAKDVANNIIENLNT